VGTGTSREEKGTGVASETCHRYQGGAVSTSSLSNAVAGSSTDAGARPLTNDAGPSAGTTTGPSSEANSRHAPAFDQSRGTGS